MEMFYGAPKPLSIFLNEIPRTVLEILEFNCFFTVQLVRF